MLQLSKQLHMSRTQVNSKLARLCELGLASAERRQHGTYYRALPFDNVSNLVAEQEAAAWALRSQFADISKAVEGLAAGNRSDTRHYYGMDGLKQVNWNLTKAIGEYRVFEAARIPQLFDNAFTMRCRERMAERKLVSFNLTNDKQVTADELWPLDLSLTHYRYIDPKVFTIGFEIFLFDGTITLVDNRPQVLHAVEMRNDAFSTMMRQIYDAMWNLGRPLTIEQ